MAYEPVWAIGTGRTATPEDAAAMHAVIREELETCAAIARDDEHSLRGKRESRRNASRSSRRRESMVCSSEEQASTQGRGSPLRAR